MPFKSAPPPHLRAEGSVPQMMWTVVLALLPAVLASLIFFRFNALRILTVAALSAVLAETAFQKILGKGQRAYDGSAVITAILFALLLPPTIPSWMVALGAFFSIGMGKEIFGGLGQNPFNPALVGAAFLLVSFPSLRGLFVFPLGETEFWIFLAAIFLGGIFLGLKQLIPWEIPFLYLGAFFVCFVPVLRDGDVVFLIPVFLAAFFMVTDPATLPLARPARRWFALGAGMLTAFLSRGLNVVEGAACGILLMNALSPALDRWCRLNFVRPR